MLYNPSIAFMGGRKPSKKHQMNRKLLIVLAGALSLGAFGLRAQTAAAPSSSWVVTPSFVSQYMFRGARLGGPSFQPSVEFDSGNVAVGIWNNTPMADKVPGTSDPEFDFYGSYTQTINDKLSVVTGGTIYYYPSANEQNGFYVTTPEPSIALNYTLGDVKLTPKYYYDFILHGPTYELSAAYAVPLKDLGTELDFTGTVGTFKWKEAAQNTFPDVKNVGNYWLIGVAAPFQITKDSKFTVGFAYTEGSDNFLKQGTSPKVVNTAALGRGVVSLSYAVTF